MFVVVVKLLDMQNEEDNCLLLIDFLLNFHKNKLLVERLNRTRQTDIPIITFAFIILVAMLRIFLNS